MDTLPMGGGRVSGNMRVRAGRRVEGPRVGPPDTRGGAKIGAVSLVRAKPRSQEFSAESKCDEKLWLTLRCSVAARIRVVIPVVAPLCSGSSLGRASRRSASPPLTSPSSIPAQRPT